MALIGGGVQPARATSVVAPSFPALVAEAQTIVRGKVRAIRCAWVDSPQGRVIKTYVTFAVLKRLKGPTAEELTLQFLGGEIDGQSMTVSGMPQFRVGQIEIIFVAGNGMRFCPLIGMMHGRYHVQTEEGAQREFVARDDGVPLESESDVQLPQGAGGLGDRFKHAASALTPESFEQKIAEEVMRHATLP